MKVVLELTEQEAEKLVDALNDYQDAGPFGSGWKSDVLGNLAAKVEIAVEAAKAA
jgi:hypothetical protein